LTFQFDTGSVPLSRITDAYAAKYFYQANIPDPANEGGTIPNPETKANFARRTLKEQIITIVKAAESDAAAKAASDAILPIVLT